VFNFYSIIIGLFAVGGLGVALWSWMKIVQGRKTAQWPRVESIIVRSSLDASGIPNIECSYRVNDKTYHAPVETPGASDVTPEICKRYLDQYPAETKVLVFYDPDKVEHAILQPGPKHDDWLVRKKLRQWI